jgi:broad specificity phosphatase PhoE
LRQAAALADRLAGRHHDLVVASDLDRALSTAEAVTDAPEVDERWREMDLGAWEGRRFEEVAAEYPDLLEAIRKGEAVTFGGSGETIQEFGIRALSAFDDLVDRLGDGGSALVATHGGVIDAIVSQFVGHVPERRTFPTATNTSLTVIEGTPGDLRLISFNDATHLGVDVGFLGRMRSEGVPVIAFVRHGVTRANKEGRVQGQSCWGLDAEGHAQAEALAGWYPSPDRLISSPIQRAMETAAAFGRPIEEAPEVMEMAFGEWEGLLGSEFRDPEYATRIYQGGEDLKRGHTGETFGAVVTRMADFLTGLDVDPAQRTVVVSHGAAIRAAIASFHGRGHDINRGLGVPSNTSVTHVALTPRGPMLADYALAPHLSEVLE